MIPKARPSPEELELQQKEELLQQKLETLTDLELSLSTLQASLQTFEVEYYLKVGSKYVLVDRLQAILDKILASKVPGDMPAKSRAAESQRRAEESTRDGEEFEREHKSKKDKFEVTPELRSLYRELAKLLHPDLSLDAEEKERRHHLMQQVNDAYQSGDTKKLRDILDAEKNNPENIKGDDIGSRLVRIIRKIAQVEKRIGDLERELDLLHKTDLNILFEAVTKEAQNGENLLEKMTTDLDAQIVFLQREIDKANG